MSEEKVAYGDRSKVVYKSNQDIFEEFLDQTGIDTMFIKGWKQTSKSDRIEIELMAGGRIIYISE